MVIISTGSELREPGTGLGHDSIYDANSYMLAAAARSAGAIAYRVGIVSDDPHEFSDALSDQLVRADLVVTSGGVSKGAYDVVKEVLAELGTVSFGEVAMQPGKPQGFGFVGEDATPIITLPGNPVSSYVSFEVFVLPAIRRMMGKAALPPPDGQGPAHEGHVASVPGRRQFVRARFEIDGKGAHVTPVGGHGSHLMGDLSDANALIVVGEDVDRGAGRRAGPGARARPGLLMAGEQPRLTHVDEPGAARMVDVSAQGRHAPRGGRHRPGAGLRRRWSALLRGEGVPKGDALGVARVAGIMAAKRTPDLVPLCHPLAISGVTVDLVGRRRRRRDHRDGAHHRPHRRRDGGADRRVRSRRSPSSTWSRPSTRRAVITDVRVESKTGGKSGDWSRRRGS